MCVSASVSLLSGLAVCVCLCLYLFLVHWLLGSDGLNIMLLSPVVEY